MFSENCKKILFIGGLEGKEDRCTAKICDFGLSKSFYQISKYTPQERTQLPWQWMDVEYTIKGVLNPKSDIWSFGIVLWEILSFGKEPYHGQNYEKTIAQLKTGFRQRLLYTWQR